MSVGRPAQVVIVHFRRVCWVKLRSHTRCINMLNDRRRVTIRTFASVAQLPMKHWAIHACVHFFAQIALHTFNCLQYFLHFNQFSQLKFDSKKKTEKKKIASLNYSVENVRCENSHRIVATSDFIKTNIQTLVFWRKIRCKFGAIELMCGLVRRK